MQQLRFRPALFLELRTRIGLSQAAASNLLRVPIETVIGYDEGRITPSVREMQILRGLSISANAKHLSNAAATGMASRAADDEAKPGISPRTPKQAGHVNGHIALEQCDVKNITDHSKKGRHSVANGTEPFDPIEWVPSEVGPIHDHQTDLPRIARDTRAVRAIEASVRQIPTKHELHNTDSRKISFLEPSSIHLILTSPPYWTLKEYRQHPNQLGFLSEYDEFLRALDEVWKLCHRALVPGGRLICVVGDVCLSRRKNKGEHAVVPLHASIQEHCRSIGFTNLAPIIWNKISNAAYEASGNGGGFLGKPYEPNAVIKNDIEFILMQRKPGGYRSPNLATRILSVIPSTHHKIWFQQIWTGVTGASTRQHPAPYPLELAERLIRMFSFVGDTVLDPFLGSGTTTIAAQKWGRNSIGVEVDPAYLEFAVNRIRHETDLLSAHSEICVM